MRILLLILSCASAISIQNPDRCYVQHSLSQNSTNKTSQVIENYVPEGDVAKKAKPGDKQGLKVDLEKKFNPMYNGKDAPSTGPNLDLPKELQDKEKATQTQTQRESNFYNGLPVFQLEANAHNVLSGKELANLTLKNGTILTMDAKLPSFVFVYSPSCGHCKNMKDEWLKLSHLSSKINIMAINGEN